MQGNKQKPKVVSKILKLWRSFRRRVKTDCHAADLIFRALIAADLLSCPCGSCHFNRESGDRSCFCTECGLQIWFTGNLFFRRAKLLRISYAAAWELLHKVRLVLAIGGRRTVEERAANFSSAG